MWIGHGRELSKCFVYTHLSIGTPSAGPAGWSNLLEELRSAAAIWICRSYIDLRLQGEQAISAKVFVGNLSYTTTEGQLADLLSEAGQVVDVYLPADRNTGRPRGFAFVEFSNADEAGACIEKFNEYEVDGRKLNINLAEDRPRRSPSFRPGPGPGGGGNRFGGGGGGAGAGGRPSRPKGSRRGKRGKKRSL